MASPIYLAVLLHVFAPPTRVTVIATDYAFQLPDSLPSGMTTLRLENRGSEPHEVVLVKIPDGRTLADVQKALASEGEHWIEKQLEGGPAAVIPGQAATSVTLMLSPGRYAVACGVPGKDRTPHVMKGMLKSLIVTPATRVAPAPTADDTLTMVDFAYHFATPLSAGTHTIRVVNAGSQPHMLILAKLEPGKTIDDALAWAATRDGPSPVAWITGTSALRANGVVYVHADLTPGTYMLACFLADDTDGRSHIAHGMRTQVIVR